MPKQVRLYNQDSHSLFKLAQTSSTAKGHKPSCPNTHAPDATHTLTSLLLLHFSTSICFNLCTEADPY